MKQYFLSIILTSFTFLANAQYTSVFYGLARRNTPDNSVYLSTINTSTGVVTNISTTSLSTYVNLTGAALDPYNNNFHFMGANEIKTVDLTTGTTTRSVAISNPIADSYFDNYRFNNSDTTLYGLAHRVVNDSASMTSITEVYLATVNTTTGVITQLSTSSLSNGYALSGSAIDPYEKVFYYSTGTKFIGVDMYTGGIYSNVTMVIPNVEILLVKQRDTPFQNFKEIFTHTKKNGTNIYVNIQSNPIMFEGEPAIMVLANDVTEKLEAKVALSLANMRLTTAQEIAKLGYWSNDLQNSVIHWSDEMYELFDLNKGSFELTFSNISNMYHPEDRWRMEADVNATFADKEIDEFDNRIIMPDGKTKWIHQKIRLIRDSENRPLALDGVLQDVTESKEKEQRLEESNERYRLLMKASSEALIDWDIVRDVTIWGDGFATIFGYGLSVYNNHLWSGNIHPDDREQVLRDLEQTLANPLKNVFYADFRYLKANREVTYVQHRGLIVRDKNGKPLRAIGSVMDMTEIMERNIKIENQNKAFREIAWIQSHKVRGPLSSLMGLVNILKMSPTDEISEDNLIDMIDIAANELDMIIHEIVEKSEKVVFDE